MSGCRSGVEWCHGGTIRFALPSIVGLRCYMNVCLFGMNDF